VSSSYGKSQEQAKAILGNAAKQAIAAAVRSRKPIVIERLDFADKKAALEEEGSQRARMLSSFAYKQTTQRLKAAASRAGVEVIEVNPAYTSTIGALNYAARYGMSMHQGAALAIGCRGLDWSGRPATRVVQLPTRAGGQVTLHLPVRNRAQNVWSFWSKVSRQIRATYATLFSCPPQEREARLGLCVCQTPVRYLSIAGETPARESFPEPVGRRGGI
jgi:IS605 OrfB family transposase